MDQKKSLKKGAIISGSVLLFAAIVLAALMLGGSIGASKSAQTGLMFLLFTFIPVILVSLVTFAIFVYRLFTEK